MPINKETETMISVVISKDSHKKLKEIVKVDKRSLSSQVSLLIEDFINQQVSPIREKVKNLPFNGKVDGSKIKYITYENGSRRLVKLDEIYKIMPYDKEIESAIIMEDVDTLGEDLLQDLKAIKRD